MNLTLHAGETLALVGENGAGKSTLMKILSGVYPYGTYEGEIWISGETRRFRSPKDAEQAGVAIIHQELSPFEDLSVAENLFVGRWPQKNRTPWVDWARLNQEARVWIERVGAKCAPEDRMGDLSVGNQQLVEIAKALAREGRILILDEPTSALTPAETTRLFELMMRLKKEGHGIVYISHKMNEIYALSDRITVLRDGSSIETRATSDFPENEVIAAMAGRQLLPSTAQSAESIPPITRHAPALLTLEGFTALNRDSGRCYGPFSFSLRPGEILGVAGLLGSGRSELLQGLFGDERFDCAGVWRFRPGTDKPRSPRASLRAGIAFVHESRKTDSLLSGRSLEENANVAKLVSRNLFRTFKPSDLAQAANTALARLSTKFTSVGQDIQTLSGGNQQKVVLARMLETQPELILLDEPTRGVDVGAKAEIYAILRELANQGKSLIVASSEMPELIHLCDRILVLSAGRQRGILRREEFSQERILSLAFQQEQEQTHETRSTTSL